MVNLAKPDMWQQTDKAPCQTCPAEIKRFRWKTVRQSATLNRAVLQGRQYASKHCKSSCKQRRNDRERLWERTTNSRMCLQTSDNVRVRRSNISAPRSTWNMSTNCGGIHVTQHEPAHNFTCQRGWSTHSVKSNRQWSTVRCWISLTCLSARSDRARME